MLFFNENILFEVIASFQQGWKSLEDGLFFLKGECHHSIRYCMLLNFKEEKLCQKTRKNYRFSH